MGTEIILVGPVIEAFGRGLGNRRVAIEPLVRPGDMLVLLNEFPQQSLQVAFYQGRRHLPIVTPKRVA